MFIVYVLSFQCGSIHVSRDDVYDHTSVVKNSIYHEFVSNFNRVHWDIKIGRYRITGNNDTMFSRHNPHPKDSCTYGEYGSQGFCCEAKNANFIFAFPFINLYWFQPFFWWGCLPTCELWCECFWLIFGSGFRYVGLVIFPKFPYLASVH